MAKTIEYKINIRDKNSKKTINGLEREFDELNREIKGVVVGSKHFKKLKTEINKTDKQLKKSTKHLKNHNAGLAKVGKGFSKLKMGIAAAVGAMAGFIALGKKSIENYDNEVKAQKSLEVALGHTSKKLLEQSSALQEKTKYGNESILQGQAFLAQMNVQEDQIEKITPLILDMAEAQGIGVNESFQLMAKSLGSSTNALSRYGIQIEGAVGSDERLESAVASLTDKFKGQAEAAAQIGKGPLTQLKNSYGDLTEQLGRFILRGINPLVKGLKKEVDYRTKLADIGNREAELRVESEKVNILASKLKDENLEQKDRIGYINQLKKLSPEYFGNLDSEKTKYSDIKDELEKYNNATVNKLILMEYEKKELKILKKAAKDRAKITDKEFDARTKSSKQIIELSTLRKKLIEEGTPEDDSTIVWIDQQILAYDKLLSRQTTTLEESVDFVNDVHAQNQSLALDIKSGADNIFGIYGSLGNKLNDTQKEFTTATNKNITSVAANYGRLDSNAEKWIKNAKKSAEETESVSRSMDSFRESLLGENEVIDDNNNKNDNKIKRDKNINKLAKNKIDLNIELKKTYEDLNSIKTSPDDEDLTFWENQLKLQEEARKLQEEKYEKALKDREELENKYNIKRKKTKEEEYKFAVDELKKALDKELITIEEYNRAIKSLETPSTLSKILGLEEDQVNELVYSIEDTLETLFDGIYDIRMDKVRSFYSNEFDELDKAKEKELELVGDNEDAKAEIEKKYADKRIKLEKKQAEEEKQIKIKQLMLDTAFAIAQIWIRELSKSALGTVIASIQTAALVAQTGIQLAVIKNTKYSKGGLLNGPSHEEGGILTNYGEFEGGEAVINKNATKKYAPVLSAINQSTGGNPIGESKPIIDYDLFAEILASKINDKKVYVVSHDISNQQDKDVKIINRSKI